MESFDSLRTEYIHLKCIASLSVGVNGFTLFDGRVSIVYDGILDHSKLVKEICHRGVRLLYVADNRTLKKLKDIRESYPHLMPENIKIIIVRLKYTDQKCIYCKSEKCHRWLAVSCLSEVFNFYFDHIEHDKKLQ